MIKLSNKYIRFTLLLVIFSLFPWTELRGESSDSIGSAAATGCSSTRWISQLIENGFRIHDTTVCYPKISRFALNVYNWGDRTFNSYDTSYVVGTGKNWKLLGKSYTWLETQTMLFPKSSLINMHSKLFSDAGGYISFMAVSLGYMWNIDNIFGQDTKRHTFTLDFTCSRFFVNYSNVSSEGGMILNRFGEYNGGKKFHYDFNDVNIKTSNFDAYYFFNHRKYSHAAAYSFSKYQLRTAGTAIIGLNISEQDINMDFSSLPADILDESPLKHSTYRLHYKDLAVLGGYARNWALKPRRWLLNMTLIGALGYKRTHEDATDGVRNMVAQGFRVSLSAVYNHRALFASAQLKCYGSLYYNSNFTHFNTLSSLTFIVGMRF